VSEERRSLLGIALGVAAVLGYFPSGGNGWFLLLGGVLLVVALGGPNIRRISAGPRRIEAEWWRPFTRRLRELSSHATDTLTISDRAEAGVSNGTAPVPGEPITIRPEPVRVELNVPPPEVRVQTAQALALIAEAVEQHPPASPEQLADQVADVVRQLTLWRSTWETLLVAVWDELADFVAVTDPSPGLDGRQQRRFEGLMPDQRDVLFQWRTERGQDIDSLRAARELVRSMPEKLSDQELERGVELGRDLAEDVRRRL